MAGRGRIYQRGTIYYIAYRWEGREYRESARSAVFADAEGLLATRLAERVGHGASGGLTFDDLATEGATANTLVGSTRNEDETHRT